MLFELARLHPRPHLNHLHLPKVSSQKLKSMNLVAIISYVESTGDQKDHL